MGTFRELLKCLHYIYKTTTMYYLRIPWNNNYDDSPKNYGERNKYCSKHNAFS